MDLSFVSFVSFVVQFCFYRRESAFIGG